MDFKLQANAQDYAEMALAITVGKTRMLRKKPFLRVGICLAFFVVALAVTLLLRPGDSAGQVMYIIIVGVCALGLAIAGITLVTLLLVRSKAGKLAAVMPKQITVHVDGKGAAVVGASNWYLHWEKIERMVETDHLYVFVGEDSASIFLKKSAMTGSEDAFEKLVNEHLPTGKRTKAG